MIRSAPALLLTLSLALLTTTPARAQQDPDAPTSRPAVKPGPAAGAAMAAAIKKLRAAKLTKRLTEPQHYVLRNRGQVVLLSTSGEEAGPILRLKVRVQIASEKMTVALDYEVGADGVLRRMTMASKRERRGKLREEGLDATFADGKLSGSMTRGGAPKGPPIETPWGPNALPGIFCLFFAPRLVDQGLPASLTPDLLLEMRLRPGLAPEPHQFTRSAKPTNDPKHGLIYTYKSTSKRERDNATLFVAADGPRKGVVLQLNTQGKVGYTWISAKQRAQLIKDAPLLANEYQAQRMLGRLADAQKTYKEREGKFAPSLDVLEAQGSYFARKLKELQANYLTLLRTAPDGSTWMAIAVPAEPGKTGKRYFVVNQDEKVYASETKLELDDSCAIPKGATPVD